VRGSVLDAALSAEPLDLGSAGGVDQLAIQVASTTTVNGHRMVLALDTTDPNAERWTAISVLPDGPSDLADPSHRGRWTDWLAWANVLQFLGAPEDSTGAVIAAASRGTSGDHDDIWLRHLARSAVSPTTRPSGVETIAAAEGTASLSEEQLEELDLIDDDARRLLESVLGPGGPRFVAGFETPDGQMVEAAFPDRKVGIVLPGDEVPPGWDARTVGEWTTDTLRDALREVS
jgi:hypothetical protein